MRNCLANMICAAAALAVFCGSAQAVSWKFAIVGDTRAPTATNDPGYPGNNGVNTVILGEIANQVVNDGAKFVITPGDLVSSGGTATSFTTWKNAMAPAYSAGIGVYPVRGNHDASGDGTGANWRAAFGAGAAAPYQLPGNGPTTSPEFNYNEQYMTYSFTYNNAFFVGLDQYQSTTGSSTYRVTQSWLDQQFAANTQAHVFVFGHNMAFTTAKHTDNLDDYPANRNTFVQSILAEGGKTYICGHDHYYDHTDVTTDGTVRSTDLQQLIVGGAGAELNADAVNYTQTGSNRAPYQPVAVYHDAAHHGYAVVEINDYTVTMTYKYRYAANDYRTGEVWSYTIPVPGYIWNGAGGNWSVAENWTPGGPPPSGPTAVLNFGGSSYTATNDVDLAGELFAANRLEFTNTGPVTLNTDTTSGAAGLQLAGLAAQINVKGAGSATIASPRTDIAAATTITIEAGAGQLTLGMADGTHAITGAAALTIVNRSDQPMLLGNAGGGTPFSGAVNVSAGSVKALCSSGGIFNTSAVTLTLGTGTSFDFAGNSGSIGVLTGSGTITNGAAGTSLLTVNGTCQFDGLIADGTGKVGLSKATGGVLTLTRAQAYSGPTTINAGTVQAKVDNVIPSGSALIVNTGGLLDMSDRIATVASLAGTGGEVRLGSGSLVAGGDNTTTTYAGAITGTGGRLTKTGSGALTLSGSANTYTGVTTVASGTLKAGAAGVIPSVSNLVVNSGGTFDLAGYSNAIGSLAGNGGEVKLGGGVLTVGGNNLTTSYAGVLSGTGGQFIKTGSGALTLIGPSSFTGTTAVAGGMLVVNGSLASNAVSVAGGTTLGGSGALGGAVTLSANGNLAPGLPGIGGSTGTLTIGNGLDLSAGGNMNWRLSQLSTTAGFDAVHVSAGNAVLGGASRLTLDFSLLGAASRPDASNPDVFWTTDWTGSPQLWKIIDAPGTGSTNFAGITNYKFSTGKFSTEVPTTGADAGDVFLRFTPYAPTVWNDSTTGLWSAAANWSSAPALPASEDVTVLSFAGTAPYTTTNDLGGASPFIVNKLNFSNAGAVLLDTAATATGIQFAGVGAALNVRGAGAVTITAKQLDIATNTTVNVAAGAGQLTLGLHTNGTSDSVITGSAALTIANAGSSPVLLGNAGNFTGTLNVASGAVRAYWSSGALLSNSAMLNVAAGASFDFNDNSGQLGGLAGGGEVVSPAGGLVFHAAGDRTWSGNIKGSGSVTQSGGGVLTLSGPNSYTGATNVASGTIQVGAGEVIPDASALVIQLGAALEIMNGFSETVGSVAGSGQLKLGAGTLITGYDNTGTTYSGIISGIGGNLTKIGAGALTVSGTSNTYSGATTINAGTLRIGAANALPGPSALVVNSGGSLDLNGLGQTVTQLSGGSGTTPGVVTNLATGTSLLTVTGTSQFDGLIQDGAGGGKVALTKDTGGALTLTRLNTYTGNTLISAGTLSIGAIADRGEASGIGLGNSSGSEITLGTSGAAPTAGTLQYTGPSSSTDRTLTLNQGGGGLDVSTAAAELTWGGLISGAGGLIKSGNGTLTFQAANSYAGPTAVAAGTLKLANGNDLLPTGTALTLDNGTTSAGTLDLNGWNQTVAQLNGASGTVSGVVTNRGTGTSTLTVTGTSQFYGLIQDGPGSGKVGLTKDTGGTLALLGSSTYTGGTIVRAGTLSIGTIADRGAASPLGLGNSAGADLTLGSGGATPTAGKLEYFGEFGSTNRTILLNQGGGIISLPDSDAELTWAGTISGNGGLTKAGEGILELAGPHGYNGPTNVEAGTLLVTGSLPAASAVSVAGGATLGGNGHIGGPVTVGTGGHLAPHVTAAGIAALTIDNHLNLNAGSVLDFNFASPGTGDSVQILGPGGNNGILTLAGQTVLNINALPGFGEGTYRLFGYGSLAGSGQIVVGASSAPASLDCSVEASAGRLDLIVELASARIKTWTGAVSGTWAVGLPATPGNWTDGGSKNTFRNGDAVVFDDAGANANRAITVAAPVSVRRMTFHQSTGSAYSIGGASIQLTGTTPSISQNGSGAASISAPVVLGGDTTIGGTGAGDLTISGGVSGAFALNKTSLNKLVLSGVNSYSGAMTVSAGTLSLAGGGSILNSPSVVANTGGRVLLDNSAQNVADRVAGATAVTLNGGTFSLLGNNTSASSEAVGKLTIGPGAATVAVSHGTNATYNATLQFGADSSSFGNNLTRNAADHGTVNFTAAASGQGGPGGTYGGGDLIAFGGAPGTTPTVNFIGGWAVVNGKDFAQYDRNQGIVELDGHDSGGTRATRVYNASATANVLTGTTSQSSLTGSRTINSLAVNSGTTNLTFSLSSSSSSTRTLTITSGGIVKSGNSTFTMSNGRLTSGAANIASELFFWIDQNTTTVTSSIRNNGTGAVTVVKSGAGTLVLNPSSSSTYSGGTVINGGVLAINTDSSLGASGSAVTFNGGTLQANASSISSAKPMIFSAAGGAIDTKTYTTTLTGNFTGSGPMTKIGTGNLIVRSGLGQLAGDVFVTAGKLTLGNTTTPGAIDALNDLATLNVNGATVDDSYDTNGEVLGALAGSGTLIGRAGAALEVGNNQLDSTFSGQIRAGASGAPTAGAALSYFAKNGTGTTTLSGATSDFAGQVRINNGILSVNSIANKGANCALGQGLASGFDLALGTSGLPSNTMGTLRYTGPSVTTNRRLQVNDGGGTVDVAAPTSNLTLAGAIGGTGGLSKAGPGTLTLSQLGTYTGGTRLSAGTLVVGNVFALPLGGALTIEAGGSVVLASSMASTTPKTWTNGNGNLKWTDDGNWSPGGAPDGLSDVTIGNAGLASGDVIDLGGDFTIQSLAIQSGIDFSLGGTGALTIFSGAVSRSSGASGTQTVARPIVLGADAVWDIEGSGQLVDAGGINGAFALEKTGTGTLVLSGNDTYAGGTIVYQGTLWISSAAALPAGGALTIGAGGTLVLGSGTGAADAGNAGTASAAAVPEPDSFALLMAGVGIAGAQGNATPTPEPSTLALLGIGALGLLACAWRRQS